VFGGPCNTAILETELGSVNLRHTGLAGFDRGAAGQCGDEQ
jgi:hypothetical protein